MDHHLNRTVWVRRTQTVSRRLKVMLMACLSAATSATVAVPVSYSFSGVTTANLGWNLPAGVPAVGSPFSGTLTYESSATGVPTNFPNVINYQQAITSLSFNVGGLQFSGTGGSILINGGATNNYGFIDVEAWMTYGAQFASPPPEFSGYFVNSMTLALNSPGQPLPGGDALPTDLSYFGPLLGNSYAEVDLISTSGTTVSRVMMRGPIQALSPVPEPTSLMFMVTGLLALGGEVARRRFRTKSVLAEP